MGDPLQMDVDEEEEEEEVPTLVGLAVANNDEGPLRSGTTQRHDSSLAKVPLTIVTGMTLSSNPMENKWWLFLTPPRRLSWRWKNHVGELHSKRAAWQEDCSHP